MQEHAGTTWRQINTAPPWKPDWINAPTKSATVTSKTGLKYRRQLSVVGPMNALCDARMKINGEVMCVGVAQSIHQLSVLFAVVMLPLIGFATAIARPNFRLLVFCGASAVSLAMFAIVTAIQDDHENRGDYLVFDRSQQTIELPRLNATFAVSDALGLQWMQVTESGGQEDQRIVWDLNLLVRGRDGPVRYHVLKYADKKLVRRIADFSRLPVDELRLLGKNGRSIDRTRLA